MSDDAATTPPITKAWDMVDAAKADLENLSADEVEAELAAGVAAVFTPKDYRLGDIIAKLADLALSHRGDG